jgi:hypothetical protein
MKSMNCSIHQIPSTALGSGVYSVSNRNECRKQEKKTVSGKSSPTGRLTTSPTSVRRQCGLLNVLQASTACYTDSFTSSKVHYRVHKNPPHNSDLSYRSRSYFTIDGQSVNMSRYRAPLWNLWPDNTFYWNVAAWKLWSCICGAPSLPRGRVLIWSAICQWSESRRTHNHTLLSHLRLLGSLSVASYDSQGLRWKYSYPLPHGSSKLCIWT